MTVPSDLTFRRRFCVNPYRTLRMKLGEMSCFKNWVDDKRGDPYPVVYDEGDALSESLPDAWWRIENTGMRSAALARLLGQHFPYATYDLALDSLDGSGAGLLLTLPDGSRVTILLENGSDGLIAALDVTAHGLSIEKKTLDCGCAFEKGMGLLVTSRGASLDVALRRNGVPRPVGTFTPAALRGIVHHDVFSRTTAAALVRLNAGGTVQLRAEFYLDGGVSHADMKCMRYENGMPILREGKLFMTMSSRLEAGAFQSIVSWNPSTAELKLEGALFFDAGDGLWCSDMAASAVYDRRTNEWYVWACSFSHGHILCHSRCSADIRFGITVLDVELMPVEAMEAGDADQLGAEAGGTAFGKAVLSDDRLFFGKSGDEDPDLVYDEARGKWLLILCRSVGNAYRYFLFESDDPFTGFTYVDRTRVGSNTGGSIIRMDGKLYLVCGSDFDRRAEYHVHPLNDLSVCERLTCDFDDGGFRGWGTLLPVPCGSRTRWLWMTFDRHNGSGFNWSYGNIYVFEADDRRKGYEWQPEGLT